MQKTITYIKKTILLIAVFIISILISIKTFHMDEAGLEAPLILSSLSITVLIVFIYKKIEKRFNL